jgi:hypothetical protein
MSLVAEAERILADARSADVLAIEQVAGLIDSVEKYLGIATADEEDVGPDAAPVEAASWISGGLIAMVLVGILVVLFVGLMVLYVTGKALSDIPVAGKPLGALAHAVEGGLEGLYKDAAAKIEHEAINFRRGFKYVAMKMVYASERSSSTEPSSPTGKLNARVLHFEHATDARIKDINTRMNQAHHRVEGQLHSIESDQHYINAELARVWHVLGQHGTHPVPATPAELRQLKHEVTDLTARMHHVQTEIEHLPRTSHGLSEKVEAEHEHVVKIEHEILTMRQRLASVEELKPSRRLNPEQAHQLHRAVSISNKLEPIAELAPFGEMGILALRKLLNNECRCAPNTSSPLSLIDDVVLADLVMQDGL